MRVRDRGSAILSGKFPMALYDGGPAGRIEVAGIASEAAVAVPGRIGDNPARSNSRNLHYDGFISALGCVIRGEDASLRDCGQ